MSALDSSMRPAALNGRELTDKILMHFLYLLFDLLVDSWLEQISKRTFRKLLKLREPSDALVTGAVKAAFDIVVFTILWVFGMVNASNTILLLFVVAACFLGGASLLAFWASVESMGLRCSPIDSDFGLSLLFRFKSLASCFNVVSSASSSEFSSFLDSTLISWLSFFSLLTVSAFRLLSIESNSLDYSF